ncbi:MAG: hypothetical protein HGA45_17875 [Chloroflexales bacterium]|nr:hypothetical protein [Chloroflexales bacterium]
MTESHSTWIGPAPFWPALAAEEARRAHFRRPAILSFSSDLFMDEFMAVVARDPARLAAYEARPETWREPAPLPELVDAVPRLARPLNRLRLGAAERASAIIRQLPDLSATRPLKLYQPAHQRHYLVTACLVCRVPGLPDRVIDLPNEERASFVLRRRLSVARGDQTVVLEHAMVTTPRGSHWEPLDDPGRVPDSEERLPLFGVSYVEEDGRRRRLLAGTVPVGRREHYMGAPPRDVPAPPAGAELPGDPREGLLVMQVIAPWNRLIEQANLTKSTLDAAGEPKDDKERAQQAQLIKAAREQAQTGSWYVLLELAEFLQRHAPGVWAALTAPAPAKLESVEQPVLDMLTSIAIPADSDLAKALRQDSTINTLQPTLAEALKAIAADGVANGLDSETRAYDRASRPSDSKWPGFLFPLADYTAPFLLKPDGKAPDKSRAEELQAAIVKALSTQAKAAPPLPLAARPVLGAGEQGRFVIRCVFERPHCGALRPPLVSAESAEFQIAGFFDTDAPARPIRIALPIDTTAGGLRKFDKNTAFMISDVLACQIERAKGITFGDLVLSVLPWPFHQDLPNPGAGPCKDTGAASMGMICTLSIPIITICALILLIIIVTLLDIIFKWIPFFIACFPLPGFKAKPGPPSG